MEDLSLLVNGKWITIAASDYLIPIYDEYDSRERESGICQLCIKESSTTTWHIGTTALMGYYAEFDITDRTISFTPLASSGKDEVYAEEKPSRNLGINMLKV